MKKNVLNLKEKKFNSRTLGFTLIELLAVIVILAIIALIAVPIVINIINDSKNKTNEQSVELYGRALEQSVAAYFMKYPEKEEVTKEEIEKENLISYKGKKVECDVVQIKNRKVFLSKCSVNNDKVEFEYGKILSPFLVDDADKDGEISIGDKYKYNVSENDEFNFYVLSLNENDTVNLIMDRNICEDGTTNYKEDNNYCKCAWYSKDNDNSYGPTDAIEILYNATKDWINVPDMNMAGTNAYEDEGHNEDSNYGYGKVETTVDGIKITKKDGTESGIIVYDSNKPLKARLPKYIEVTSTETKCTKHILSCVTWLIDNLRYYADKYSVNKKNIEGTTMYNINGYWTMSSGAGSSQFARYVYYVGQVSNNGTKDGTKRGIRPVITVPRSILES